MNDDMKDVSAMTQTERIGYMEALLNEGRAAVEALSRALEAYALISPHLAELFDYYGSELWFADLEDDTAGLLPDGLPRGVLSEDAVYNLIGDNARLLEELEGFAQL